MEFTTMARGEITGKKPVQTADEAKRLSGPPIADATAIEPTAKSEPDSHSKGKATPIRGPPVPPAWYTQKEFCQAHRLSEAMFFKLKTEGRGPREIAIGSRRFITFEDAATWRAARQQETAA
jgi:hypothetical protein